MVSPGSKRIGPILGAEAAAACANPVATPLTVIAEMAVVALHLIYTSTGVSKVLATAIVVAGTAGAGALTPISLS